MGALEVKVPGDGRVTGNRPGDREAAGRRRGRGGAQLLQDEAAAQAVVREVTEAGGRAVAVRADQGSLDDLQRLTGQADEPWTG